jgi:hypothetical protein
LTVNIISSHTLTLSFASLQLGYDVGLHLPWPLRKEKQSVPDTRGYGRNRSRAAGRGSNCQRSTQSTVSYLGFFLRNRLGIANV